MQGAWVTGCVAWLVCLGVCVWAHAEAPSTSPAVLAVPDSAQRLSALRQINELRERHPLEYGPARLLELAREEGSSPAMRYAAAYRAMELAAVAGRVKIALAALEHLENQYHLDELDLRQHLLKELLKSPQRTSAAILAMRWTEDLYRSGHAAEAGAYARAVEQCQRDLSSELQQAASDYLEDHKYALTCLPSVAGCLYRGEWDANLAALAQSSDALAATAGRDVAAKSPAERMDVADAWWSAGADRGGTTGWRIARRSAEIYRDLLAGAGGVERELIASRLAEHDGRWLLAQGYVPGLAREIWRGESKERRSDIARDLEIERDDAKLELPRTGGHVNYHGFILITTPGQHEFIVTAGSSIRLLIDGEMRLDNPTVYRKRSGERVGVELVAGLHEIDLEVWASSSQPRLHVEWITPSSTDKRSIPQTSFFYDPLKQ